MTRPLYRSMEEKRALEAMHEAIDDLSDSPNPPEWLPVFQEFLAAAERDDLAAMVTVWNEAGLRIERRTRAKLARLLLLSDERSGYEQLTDEQRRILKEEAAYGPH